MSRLLALHPRLVQDGLHVGAQFAVLALILLPLVVHQLQGARVFGLSLALLSLSLLHVRLLNVQGLLALLFQLGQPLALGLGGQLLALAQDLAVALQLPLLLIGLQLFLQVIFCLNVFLNI